MEIRCARDGGSFSLLLDVGVQVRDEDEAIATDADVVMLDNIDGSELASIAWYLYER